MENGKVYSAFSVRYKGELGEMGSIYPYMGRLESGTSEVSAYAKKTLRGIKNSLQGAEHNDNSEEARRLREVVEGIEREYL